MEKEQYPPRPPVRLRRHLAGVGEDVAEPKLVPVVGVAVRERHLVRVPRRRELRELPELRHWLPHRLQVPERVGREPE